MWLAVKFTGRACAQVEDIATRVSSSIEYIEQCVGLNAYGGNVHVIIYAYFPVPTDGSGYTSRTETLSSRISLSVSTNRGNR